MPHILPHLLFLIFAVLVERSQEVEPQPCPENPIALNASEITQYIHSPYDEDGLYPPNTDCRFVLTARSLSHRIQITVLDSEMEEPLFMQCNDYGSFRDGNTSTATEIVRWCGVEFPQSLSSANNILFFHFHSDSIIQRFGFQGTVGPQNNFSLNCYFYAKISKTLEKNMTNCLFTRNFDNNLVQFNRSGINLSFVDFELPGCPPEWLVGPEKSFCYKLFSTPATWLDAQRACNYEQSNLLTFTTNEEYGFVTDSFSSSHALPWIGYTDAVSEGRFESVNEDPLWPERFPSLSGQQEDRDCVFLDWDQIQSVGYAVDDCRKRHTYICKKKSDGQTQPIVVASTLVRDGLPTTSSMNYIVLLAVLILLLLLLILIWIGYQQYKKRKAPTQVANLDQNQRFVSGAVSSTSIGAAHPPTSQMTNTSTTAAKHLTSTSKLKQNIENDQNASENESPRLSMTPNQPGVVSPGTNNLAFDHDEELGDNTAKGNQSRQHMYERDNGELGNSTTIDDGLAVTRVGMPVRELTTLTTTTMQTNVALSHASTTGSRIKTRRKSFERPHISVLDSVSAISMDEFWQKQS